MKIFIIFLHLMAVTPLVKVTGQINIVQLNCPDSLGFITNMGQTKACEFLFENETPNLFYVENFSHRNFYDLIYKDSVHLLLRGKLIMPGYTANIHDFLFAWNNKKALLFHYILKDHQEEKQLNP